MKNLFILTSLTFLMLLSCEVKEIDSEEQNFKAQFKNDSQEKEELVENDDFLKMKSEMDLFTKNVINNMPITDSENRITSGFIPNRTISYNSTTQQVSGSISINTTQRPPNATTQWMTFDFSGNQFFGSPPFDHIFAQTHIAIAVLAYLEPGVYGSGVGAILGTDFRGNPYPTAYYESYWNGGNHLDFMDDDYNSSNHPRLYDFPNYKFILYANHNGWTWFRIVNASTGEIVINRVRRYVNANMNEILQNTGIFIQGIKAPPVANRSYTVQFNNIRYGWF